MPYHPYSATKKCGHKARYACSCRDEVTQTHEATMDVVDYMIKRRDHNWVVPEPEEED